MVGATPAASPQGRRCGTCSCSQSQQNSYSESCGLRVCPARAGNLVLSERTVNDVRSIPAGAGTGVPFGGR